MRNQRFSVAGRHYSGRTAYFVKRLSFLFQRCTSCGLMLTLTHISQLFLTPPLVLVPFFFPLVTDYNFLYLCVYVFLFFFSRNIPVVLDAEKDRPFLKDLLPLADYIMCNGNFPQAFTGRCVRSKWQRFSCAHQRKYSPQHSRLQLTPHGKRLPCTACCRILLDDTAVDRAVQEGRRQ